MTMLRTIIVDDEPLAIERLEILCANQTNIALVATASDGAQAIRLAKELRPDLLLLDISMPTMDGINTARALSLLDKRPAVIFVTAHDNFALEAFDLDIVDYMLKPVAVDRLSRAVERVLRLKLNADTPDPTETKAEKAKSDDPLWAHEFWVSHRTELLRVAVEEIERIEAERDYMRLHLNHRSYLLHQTISALEMRLDPDRFMRIHRSHIVRRDLVTSLRHEGGGVWHAVLRSNHELRIGRKYLSDVKKLAGR